MKGFIKISAVLLITAACILTLVNLTPTQVESSSQVNQTVNVSASATCTVWALNGTEMVGFGNISTGNWGEPTGQDWASMANDSAINVSADSANNDFMFIKMTAGAWTESGGHTFDTGDNEDYDKRNLTYDGISDSVIGTAMPESATTIDDGLGADNNTYIFLNLSVPAAQWAGQYSSNVTITCGVSAN